MNGDATSNECDLLVRLRDAERIFGILRDATGTELQIQQQLRSEFPDEIVRSALTLQELRRKASGKFTRADRMWFDRTGLEQATPEAVARHKAMRFQGDVWDFCCGIGSDAIALAERCSVNAVDNNPAACLRTKWNAEVYGVADRVRTVCAGVESIADRNGLLHVDPDRRPGNGRRVRRIEQYVPDFETLERLSREFRGGAIKLGPASNFGGKFSDTEIELVSLYGECKEATVWFGELAGEAPFRATVLPWNVTIAGAPLDAVARITPLERYLYDPDPAVVRAGLVDAVAESLDLARLDDAEEYLTSAERVESPFVSAFEVLAELPNNDRQIRSYFRDADFGQVEIKCRHIPVDAQAVRRKLPLTGQQPAVLVFARIERKSRAVVCRRV